MDGQVDPGDPPIWSDGEFLYCELCGEQIAHEADIAPHATVLAHRECLAMSERRERTIARLAAYKRAAR